LSIPAATKGEQVKVRIGIAAACLMIVSTPAVAWDVEPLSTDRPDFVESSLTVGTMVFQFEAGVIGARTDLAAGRYEQYATPFLLRFGVAKAWELRLETAGYLREELGGETDSGFADAALGVKWHSMDGGEVGSAKPSMAWLVHVDLGVGSKAFRIAGAQPSLRGVAEWAFTEKLAFGTMFGLRYNKSDDENRYTAGIFGAVLGFSFTDRFRGFVEFAAPQIASADDGGNIMTWDLGVAYLISPDWQVDGSVAFGANDNSLDFLWAVGLSGRFGARE
jgi:hypothetical protein